MQPGGGLEISGGSSRLAGNKRVRAELGGKVYERIVPKE
jgi:hypothetical protein